MQLPRHICLSIQHNPHRGMYQDLGDWLAAQLAMDDLAIHPRDHAAIRELGEVWVISWCPDTPVGSCQVIAATLERALERAND